MINMKLFRLVFVVIFMGIIFSNLALADDESEAAKKELVSVLNTGIAEGTLHQAMLNIAFDMYMDDGRTDEAFKRYLDVKTKIEKLGDVDDAKVAIEKHNGEDILIYEHRGERVEILNIPQGFHMGIVKVTKEKVVKLIVYSMLGIIRHNDINTLHQAAVLSAGMVAELLISKGADVNALDKHGDTPLHLAVGEGDSWMIEFFISKGADVNTIDKGGDTPLHLAVQNGHTPIIRLLIDQGAKVDIENKYGKTPLDISATNGQTGVAKLLIAEGANASRKNSSGRTLLHYAAKAGKTEMVLFLLDEGASVSKSDIDIAEENGHIVLGSILRESTGVSREEQLEALIGHTSISSREKAIILARNMMPPPVISETVIRLVAEGSAAMKVAKNIEGYEAAEEKFQKASNLAPWWADTYFNLALVHEKLRNYYDTIEDLKLYLFAAPAAPDASAVQLWIYEIEYLQKQLWVAEDLTDSGIDMYYRDDLQGAIGKFKEAIQADPEYGKAHFYLAGMYTELGRFEEAIPEAEEAILLGYREQKVYAELAECYYELDDVKKAISVLEDGLRISSIHHTYLHQMLGQYYRDEGQYENALNHLEEVQYWIKKDEKGDWGFVLDGIDKDWVQRTIEKLKDLLGR